MTEPIVPEESTGASYTSDRNLLLQEIQLLSKEVGRLRGDTKHLNEVTVPREEQRRRARASRIAALVGFLLLALPLLGFYVQQQQINDDRAQFKQRSVELCEARNDGNRNLDALIKALLAPPPNSDVIEPPNPGVTKALADFEKTLDQIDCSRLVTD